MLKFLASVRRESGRKDTKTAKHPSTFHKEGNVRNIRMQPFFPRGDTICYTKYMVTRKKMPKEIPLISRYTDVFTKLIQLKDNTYKAVTSGHFVRCILDHDMTHINAIDFEGGPMIGVGDVVEGVKINKIWHSKEHQCYLVELI